MNRALRTAVMTALLLAAGNSWALGLGQIQVKSKRNQPLVAEIPIISTTPGELAALQARLASPETFRRIGLSPPSGAAADLQFSLGSDSKGRPVIRVTTLKPVDQGALNFLVEVDWGTGRLVREYSALVDTPDTAAAGVQPSVQLPQAPAANLVQRPQPALPAPLAPAAAPAPVAAATQASTAPAQPVPAASPPEPLPAPTANIAPVPASIPVPPTPVPPPAAPVAAASAPTEAQYGPVKRGETLSKIVGAVGLRSAFSLDQSMLALLRANPEAFLGDDVNRLRSGAILRVPGHDDVAKIDADEATQVVRQQMQQWQQARHAVRLSEETVATQAEPTRKPADSAATADATEPKQAPAHTSVTKNVATVSRKPAASSKPATAANPPAPEHAQAKLQRRNEARLQIVPPTGPGKATGMKSGTDAGGKGSMLQQELRQRDEDIAAKTAEIGELKERVASLEKLKDEQQKLIALKDTELATAQAHLAQANQAQAQAQAQAQTPAKPQTAAPVAATTTSQQPAPAPDAPKHKAMPYVWGGVGFAALALLAWLLAGRRKPAATPVRRSVFDSEALAASMVAMTTPEDTAETAAEPIFKPIAGDAVQAAEVGSTAPTPARTDTPAWHSGWVKAEPEPEPAAPAADAQAAVQSNPVAAPAAATTEAAPAHASIEQRFKLVDAFLDMGDKTSAQQILAELLNDEDDAASEKAGRMLSKLMG
ncbi:MAG: hypothetical protein KGL91_04635 [Xanthomonadaceae bacterium]|nr:hypothetical protein [Xanthomonadaceae bacterium]